MSSTRIYGLDVSDAITADQWTCLTGRDCQFVVVRAYRNAHGGEPDDLCPATVADAWAAGMKFVDVYAFPVPAGSKSAAAQATELLGFLVDNHLTWGRIWLDVESAGGWPDAAASVTFIQDYVAAITAAGHAIGIYCGTEGWDTITDRSTVCSHLPLWWSSHGKEFSHFGGWTAPALVQYAYDTKACDMTYDSDYCDDPPASAP